MPTKKKRPSNVDPFATKLNPLVYEDEESIPLGLGVSMEIEDAPMSMETEIEEAPMLHEQGLDMERLMRALVWAETNTDIDEIRAGLGSEWTGKYSNNPWTRTTDNTWPGSAAYGPGQIIAGQDNLGWMLTKYPEYFSEVDPDYIKILNDQREKFLKYGISDLKEGEAVKPLVPGYDIRWDYSTANDNRGSRAGTGDPRARNPEEYFKLMEGFIKSKWHQVNKSPWQEGAVDPLGLEKLLISYRDRNSKQDPRYYKALEEKYGPIYSSHGP